MKYLVLEQKINGRDVRGTALDGIASIKQRITFNALQITRRSSERVTESTVRRLHKTRDARTGVEYHTAIACGIKRIQTRRKTNHRLAYRDAC